MINQYNNKGEKHGIWKEEEIISSTFTCGSTNISKDEEGLKTSKGNYINGLRDGKWLFICDYKRSTSRSSMEYSHGKRHGYWETMNSKSHFNNDEITYRESRYDDGTLWTTYNYKNGLYHGLNYVYYPNGMINSVINWEECRLNGISEKYNINGKLVKRSLYKDGELISEEKL